MKRFRLTADELTSIMLQLGDNAPEPGVIQYEDGEAIVDDKFAAQFAKIKPDVAGHAKAVEDQRKAERDAYLDGLIDEMDARRAERDRSPQSQRSRASRKGE